MVRVISVGNGLGGWSEIDSITNGSPAINYQSAGFIVIGCWFNPSFGTGGATIWKLSDSLGGQIALTVPFGGSITFSGTDNNAPTTFNLAIGAVVSGAWHFAMCRLSQSFQYLDVIDGNGVTAQTSGGSGLTFLAGSQLWTIGSMIGSSTNGIISTLDVGEFWYCDSDIGLQSNGLLESGLVTQLGRFGPFSSSYVANKLVEYRRWNRAIFAIGEAQDSYVRPDKVVAVSTPWIEGTTTASATKKGSQPPLSPTYIRLRQTKPIVQI